MRKANRWRGLTFVLSIFLAVMIVAGSVLETYATTIDDALGTQSAKVVITEGEEEAGMFESFKLPDSMLNADGTGNAEAMIRTYIEFGRRQASGGTVLLKNDNQALPLASGSKVTLLGIRSHKMIQGASVGMPIRGPVINFEEALSGDHTNFHNPANLPTGNEALTGWREKVDSNTLTDYSFTDVGGPGAGYVLNPDMIAVYETINQTLGFSCIGPQTTGKDYDPKEPSLNDIAAVNAQFQDSFSAYSDAAIVVVGRPSGEGKDYLVGGATPGTGATEPLELTTNERDIINLACEKFDRVIVLVNTTSAMEIDELKHDERIDAILWVGHPGNYGTLGIADVLCGRVGPSGGMPDIYAAKNLSHPGVMNVGAFVFSNKDAVTRKAGNDAFASYTIEAEDIYTGYRYYETRYNDCVYGIHNADSAKGAVASDGNWNYASEVSYGFGYGLNYTTFEKELVGEPKVVSGEHELALEFTVRVTNTGNSSGRCNVQLYGQAPYIEGGLEKSAIQLLAYDKTKELAPNESQDLRLYADMQNIASYDMSHKNADGTFGTWILDGGSYYFAVGNGAHDALNNVLAAQGKTIADGMDYDGNASLTYVYVHGTEGVQDDKTFSVSITGEKVSNHLEYSDYNYYAPGTVTELSRSDWDATYPIEYADLEAPQSLIDHLNGKYYELKKNDDVSDIHFGVDSGMRFSELAFTSFDDEQWDTLLDQITLEDAMGIIACCGNDFRALDSVGFLKMRLTENSGNGVDMNIAQTVGQAAPWSISREDPNNSYEFETFASGPVVAASFDPALQFELGEKVGMQALTIGLPILWGPGLNTHRTPYNGRNGDYYSEDPVLCGNIALEFSIGALEYGLIAAPKHFAFNDQETYRNGIAPFMTEQRAREIELRAFQIAVEAKKYDRQAPAYWDKEENHDFGMIGLMTSFSKIGGVECTSSRGLMTDILQKEWGFHGYAVTDISDDMDLFTPVAYAGTTGYDVRSSFTLSGFKYYQSMADKVKVEPALYEKDAEMLKSIKLAAKNVLWAFCQSNLMNQYSNVETETVWNMTWWRGLYIGGIAVFGCLAVACAVLYVFNKKKEGRKV